MLLFLKFHDAHIMLTSLLIISATNLIFGNTNLRSTWNNEAEYQLSAVLTILAVAVVATSLFRNLESCLDSHRQHKYQQYKFGYSALALLLLCMSTLSPNSQKSNSATFLIAMSAMSVAYVGYVAFNRNVSLMFLFGLLGTQIFMGPKKYENEFHDWAFWLNDSSTAMTINLLIAMMGLVTLFKPQGLLVRRYLQLHK